MNNNDHQNENLTKFLTLLALVSLATLPFKRQVWLMSKARFEPNEIAKLLGTTANSVSVRLSEMRKELKEDGSKEDRNVGRVRRAKAH
jgi:DNA-directed RNA polymerase specialized sigma24 family protein